MGILSSAAKVASKIASNEDIAPKAMGWLKKAVGNFSTVGLENLEALGRTIDETKALGKIRAGIANVGQAMTDNPAAVADNVASWINNVNPALDNYANVLARHGANADVIAGVRGLGLGDVDLSNVDAASDLLSSRVNDSMTQINQAMSDATMDMAAFGVGAVGNTVRDFYRVNGGAKGGYGNWMKRVGGAYAGATALRYMRGGSAFYNPEGQRDIVGIPFI